MQQDSHNINQIIGGPPALSVDKVHSKSRKRKNGRGKKKVIETTKTTSVLFHGGLNNTTGHTMNQNKPSA